MLDLAFLTEQVRITAKEAGTFIREERKKFDRNVVEKKHAHDYVSYVDKDDNAPYCVSIALRGKTGLLIGVVYEITRDECFWTYKGSASYLNGTEIHVSSVSALDDAFIELGFPYNAEAYRPMAVHLVNTLYGNVGGLRLMGAAAVELCYVAAGRFEARIEAFLGPWDIAAGTLILENAGGKVSDFKGGNSFYSGAQVLASNGKLHADLLDIIGKL